MKDKTDVIYNVHMRKNRGGWLDIFVEVGSPKLIRKLERWGYRRVPREETNG